MADLREWQIERFVLGELPGPEREAVARAIAEDPELRARVEALDASNREILAEHPPRVAATVIRERAEALRRWSLPAWGPAVALAACLAAAVGVLVPREVGVEAPAETRIKGARPHLGLFRQTSAGVEALPDGSLAREGDLVQLTYQAAGRRFGAILSIDGRGAVTVHLPREGRTAARLVPGQDVRLPSAYRLDDAPRWERFVLVTGDHPFDLAPVVDAAERLAASAGADAEPLALEASLEQSSFTITKDHRR